MFVSVHVLLLIAGLFCGFVSGVPSVAEKRSASVNDDSRTQKAEADELYDMPESKVKAENSMPSFNPELGSHLEGDIVLKRNKKARWARNANTDRSPRWANATLPYTIDPELDMFQRKRLDDVFEEFHKHTCIRFVPHTAQRDYISFESHGSYCWSSVGRHGGKQPINLAPSCFFQMGSIIHELMHTLGFWHEQNRPDRDEFITIRDENVNPRYWKNFVKANEIETFHIPYDFGSVMHYSDHAFSTNGKPTIVAKPGFGQKTSAMGQRAYFSASDVKKINKMYCSDSPVIDPDPVVDSAPVSVSKSSSFYSRNSSLLRLKLFRLLKPMIKNMDLY